MPRINLHQKVLFAFLVLAFVPLAFLASYSTSNLREVEVYLRDSATRALDQQAAQALELRAQMVAEEFALFLRRVEEDLHDLTLIPATAENYARFQQHHRRPVWYRTGTNAAPVEVREDLPLYREVTLVDPDGRERIRIKDGSLSTQLRDLSEPRNTTYLTEDYFLRARELAPGEIHVTHLTGWHVGKREQLGDAATPEEAVEGAKYEGVVRFVKPLHDAAGELTSVLVLSLDHRHLMAFTQHITPTAENYVLFPSYDSGNYAFMFDDEGWIITHPKFWNLRGLDSDGRLVPPYTPDSSAQDIAAGRIPYNLFYAGFIHPNYPVAAEAVRRGEVGVVDVTNVGGSRKIMAYAPIPYDRGVYRATGVFGGITIGAELRQFHQAALETSSVIRAEVTRFMHRSWLLVTLTMVVVFVVAWWLTQGITGPLLRLTEGTRQMARGKLAGAVKVSRQDEVGELTESFNAMARELVHRRRRLIDSLAALRRSRTEIMRERNFKRTILENIETGILTLDENHRVTSLNGAARQILGLGDTDGTLGLLDCLGEWPELEAPLREALPLDTSERWARYVKLERQGRVMTLRLALVPLLAQSETKGRILTVEDLTERVNMREHLERMERLASLGRLSAGIAHEIRNPLTGISIMLDDLHDRMLSNPADQTLIQRALQEMERLEGLVNELLTFATTAKSTLRPGPLAPVLRDILFLVEKQCERTNITLEQRIADNLPVFPLDSAKLKQAFLNLLTNAIAAMPDGGRLGVHAECRADQVQVVIEDSGEGIPEDRLPLIFEPFYTSKGEGTGLGLSITHNIISDHGGRIEVKSQPGQGTQFVLWFPVNKA
ncbi:ATP-binding protein [Geoalkalibacter halelectricus]|uniref:histidine kinase n=1 Tax=Geoalkalibacter halelectricus TaxID=2847045 RepID=A0ABY5ZPI7_9BACT|nr:ATP-binding protein [Geoalkalibacter halelectricus]MDO3379258.1 ATP-binding protein [Geoalkalibacter halelectricus]UWZ81016.1 ATP-binding protein [Geoalkalibacter halelectricus]